jgi:hypothetical protein
MKCHPLRIVEMITRRWKAEFRIKAIIGNHRTILGYLVAGGDKRKGLTVEDALTWENLAALASTVFINLIKPNTHHYRYEKNAKRKKSKDPVN